MTVNNTPSTSYEDQPWRQHVPKMLASVEYWEERFRQDWQYQDCLLEDESFDVNFDPFLDIFLGVLPYRVPWRAMVEHGGMPIRENYFGEYFNTLEVKEWLQSLLAVDHALAIVKGQDHSIDRQEDAQAEGQ